LSDLRETVFADGCAITLGAGTFDFHNCVFGDSGSPGAGRVVIRYATNATARLDSIKAYAQLEVQPSAAHQALNWTFRNAECFGEVDLRNVPFAESLDLTDALFHARVRFEGTTMPQQTRAHGLRFEGAALSPSAEGSYRAARIVFADHKNRELEGVFYALEKRSHRRSLGRVRNWFARLMSALYDYTSAYGQRFERTALWFVGVQVLAGAAYSVVLKRWELCFCPDWGVMLFTISQLVKPFELLSGRRVEIAMLAGLGEPRLHLLSFLTFVHAAVSLILLALMLLAIRWRFRRD
jgi:hypothetical protein